MYTRNKKLRKVTSVTWFLSADLSFSFFVSLYVSVFVFFFCRSGPPLSCKHKFCCYFFSSIRTYNFIHLANNENSSIYRIKIFLVGFGSVRACIPLLEENICIFPHMPILTLRFLSTRQPRIGSHEFSTFARHFAIEIQILNNPVKI